MLLRPRTQPRVSSHNDPRRLLHLSTPSVSMGSLLERSLREADVSRSVYWHSEFPVRCYHSSIADADSLAFADGQEKKSHLEWNLWNGHRVSTFHWIVSYRSPGLVLIYGLSICGLTLYRLYTTVSIDPNDWVHGYAVVILVTCLEALLGIINACLPALGPLVHKLGAFTSRKSNDVISMISRGNNSSPMHGKPKQRQTSNNYFTIGDETSSIQTSAWPKDQTSNASAVHHLDIARDGSDTPEHTTRPPSENELPGIHVRSDVNVDITAVVGKSWDGYSGNW